MKLYYAESVCSLAVRIIVHELDLPCEFEAVDLKTKLTQKEGNYLHINSKGSVPALLLDNGLLLTENAVILQYLADNNKAFDLLPPIGDLKRYRTLEWLNYVSTDLHRYCAPLFWSRFSDEVKNNIFLPILKRKLTVVDNHLERNLYLIEDSFSLADSYLFVILIWLAKLHLSLNEWPNLLRYFYLLKQRPSILKSIDEERLTTF